MDNNFEIKKLKELIECSNLIINKHKKKKAFNISLLIVSTIYLLFICGGALFGFLYKGANELLLKKILHFLPLLLIPVIYFLFRIIIKNKVIKYANLDFYRNLKYIK
ncbi:hypothetical protein, partial [[Mycoplasma] falconis]|uniref:hypothetical protein n=1 Tax=[Mycoplasma] falconis TaxID=92403 RepID=UPI001B86CEE5